MLFARDDRLEAGRTHVVASRHGSMSDHARWLLAGIVLVSAGLRLVLIGALGVRLDEVFTWWVATLPGQDLLSTIVASDTHPPLFYLLEHVWLQVSQDPIWARLPAAVLGVALVPVVYAIGRAVRGSATGLIAAGLVAVSPWHLWHSQDARGYTLLTLAVAVAALAALRMLDGQRPARWSAAFAAGGAVAVLTHNVGIVLVGALGVATAVFLVRRSSPHVRTWLVANAAVGVAWLLWVPALLRQLGHVEQNLAWVDAQVRWWTAPAATVAAWVGAPPAPGADLWFVAAGVTVLVGFGVGALRRCPDRLGVLLSLLLTLPLVEAASLIWSPMVVTRTLLPTSVALFVLLGAALTSFHWRGRVVGATMVVGALVVGTVRLADHAPPRYWEDVTATLESNVAPADPVLYVMNVGELATRWLGEVPGDPIPLPGDFEQRLVWDERVTASSIAMADRRIPDHAPVWLVYGDGPRMDPDGAVTGWLASERRLDLHLQFGGIEVRRYEPISSELREERHSSNRRAANVANTSSASNRNE